MSLSTADSSTLRGDFPAHGFLFLSVTTSVTLAESRTKLYRALRDESQFMHQLKSDVLFSEFLRLSQYLTSWLTAFRAPQTTKRPRSLVRCTPLFGPTKRSPDVCYGLTVSENFEMKRLRDAMWKYQRGTSTVLGARVPHLLIRTPRHLQATSTSSIRGNPSRSCKTRSRHSASSSARSSSRAE